MIRLRFDETDPERRHCGSSSPPCRVRRWRRQGPVQLRSLVRRQPGRRWHLQRGHHRRVAMPVESLQHPLAVYDALLCPELLEVFA